MGMKEWAEREVQIACKRENPDRKEGEFDYGCACYESALKAFNSLMEDGHSGMSIGFTQQILNRLIDGKPLTPIEDTEDFWKERCNNKKECKNYQCKRKSSLFKYVYLDGTVKYSDINRVIGVDMVNDSTWHSGMLRDIVDEEFPITMPYSGEGPYEVYFRDFLYDPNHGDFDTRAVLYIKTPDGEDIDVYKYFKEDNNDFVEIPFEEYMFRLRNRKE